MSNIGAFSGLLNKTLTGVQVSDWNGKDTLASITLTFDGEHQVTFGGLQAEYEGQIDVSFGRK